MKYEHNLNTIVTDLIIIRLLLSSIIHAIKTSVCFVVLP